MYVTTLSLFRSGEFMFAVHSSTPCRGKQIITRKLPLPSKTFEIIQLSKELEFKTIECREII